MFLAGAYIAMLVAFGSGTLRGTVRSSVDSLPLRGVVVTIVASGRTAVTAGDGSYVIDSVPGGAQEIRFAHDGYRALTITARLGGPLTMDVALEPEPVHVASVRVVAQAPALHGGTGAGEARPLGGWTVSGEALRHPVALDQGDAFRALATAPAVQMAPESPSELHIRGGRGDENLVLLDGIPIASASHAGELPSPVNPDALQSVTLHGGAPGAEYGGRLSGVIDLRTAAPRANRLGVTGTVTSAADGIVVSGPLLQRRSAFLLSARRGYGAVGSPSASGEQQDGPGANGWHDLLGVVSLGTSRDSLTLLAFGAGDALAFDTSAVSPDGASALTTDGAGGTGADGGGAGPGANTTRWRSFTSGVAWRHTFSGATLRAVGWRSAASAGIRWNGAAGPLAVASEMRQSGATATIWWDRTLAGTTIERLHPRYSASLPGGSCSASCGLALDARIQLASVFLQRAWGDSRHWMLRTGVRATTATIDAPLGRSRRILGRSPTVDPRVELRIRASRQLELAAGYARTHQYTQSAWNEESPADAFLAVSVPVAAGAGGVPAASSDAFTASATMHVAPQTRVGLDWYTRRVRGLVSLAALGPDPLAESTIPSGSAHAWGVGVTADHRSGPLSIDWTWAYSRVTRISGMARYYPAFAPRQQSSIVAAYRLGRLTTVRVSGVGEEGRRSTAVAGPMSWSWRQGLGRRRVVRGAPTQYRGAIGGTRLPPYLRVDAGLQRDIPLRRTAAGELTGFASVDNLLGRRNVFGYVVQAGGRMVPLPMLPRSVIAGLSWRF